jgi:hypothetical protein
MHANMKDMTIIVPNGQWYILEFDAPNEVNKEAVITQKAVIAFAIQNELPNADDRDVIPITISGLHICSGVDANFPGYLRPDGEVELAYSRTQWGYETFENLKEYREHCLRTLPTILAQEESSVGEVLQ